MNAYGKVINNDKEVIHNNNKTITRFNNRQPMNNNQKSKIIDNQIVNRASKIFLKKMRIGVDNEDGVAFVSLKNNKDIEKIPTHYCHIISFSIGKMMLTKHNSEHPLLILVRAKKSDSDQWVHIGPIAYDEYVYQLNYSVYLFPGNNYEEIFCCPELSYEEAMNCLKQKGLEEVNKGYLSFDGTDVWVSSDQEYGQKIFSDIKTKGFKNYKKNGDMYGISLKDFENIGGVLPNSDSKNKMNENMVDLDNIEFSVISRDSLNEPIPSSFEITVKFQSFDLNSIHMSK